MRQTRSSQISSLHFYRHRPRLDCLSLAFIDSQVAVAIEKIANNNDSVCNGISSINVYERHKYAENPPQAHQLAAQEQKRIECHKRNLVAMNRRRMSSNLSVAFTIESYQSTTSQNAATHSVSQCSLIK